MSESPAGDLSFGVGNETPQGDKSKFLNDSSADELNRSLPPLTPLTSAKFGKYQQSSPIRIGANVGSFKLTQPSISKEPERINSAASPRKIRKDTSSLITDSFDSSVGDDSVFCEDTPENSGGNDELAPSFMSQNAPFPATYTHVVNTLKQKQRAHLANLSPSEREVYLTTLEYTGPEGVVGVGDEFNNLSLNDDQCVPQSLRDYCEAGAENASLFETDKPSTGLPNANSTLGGVDISDPSVLDEMELGIRCYFKDYIETSTQLQKYEDFKDALLSSTRNLDESLNNGVSSANNSLIPSPTNSNEKTRSILFFLEGFEQQVGDESIDFRTSVSSQTNNQTSLNSNNNGGIDIQTTSSLRTIEAKLMLQIKLLKRENAANPLVNNEIYISVLTFVASEPKLNKSIVSKMGQLIDHLDENEFSQAKQIQTGLRLNYRNETSSWIVGIEKLIAQLAIVSKKQLEANRD